jgi:hypothetical protein
MEPKVRKSAVVAKMSRYQVNPSTLHCSAHRCASAAGDTA